MNDFTPVSLMDIQLMDKSFDLDNAICQNELMKKNNKALVTVVVITAGVTAIIICGYLRERKERKTIELRYATERDWISASMSVKISPSQPRTQY